MNRKIFLSAFHFLGIAATALLPVFAEDARSGGNPGPILVGLEVGASREILLVGESLQLRVEGSFADGSKADLSNRAETLYSLMSGEAIEVGPGGILRGISPGEGVVLVVHQTSVGAAMATLSLSVRAPGDRDGDSLPDEYEVLHQLNPDFAGDANLDVDEDGLSNLDELDAGTNPRRPDTDGDFQPDGLEFAVGTDPLVPEQRAEGEPPLLDDSCVVSALNRSARVQPNGVWVLPNVPANAGRVRVRATCVKDGDTHSGQSDFFTIPPNGTIEVAEILFDTLEPIPAELILSAPQTVLTAAGQTVQLTATARFPDGTIRDLSAAASGTGYISSNSAIASVTADGLVTARVSGTVVVSALNDGALGVLRLRVSLSGDSDGDGLPDDVELANGLDPNNPFDVLDDPDADELSTADEFQAGLNPFDPDTDNDRLLDGREWEIGTNPLLADTDGEQISDGLEVLASSDPLDPNSVNLGPILAGLTIEPSAFTLTFNTLETEISRRVTVVAELIDGSKIDATRRLYGTLYASSDLSVASFGAEDGRVFGGRAGSADVTATVATKTAVTHVTVESFQPTMLAILQLPGLARAVDLVGTTAYVAVDPAGLVVVDVAEPSVPRVLGSALAKAAVGVAVAGDVAYLITPEQRLYAIDVADLSHPAVLSSLALPRVPRRIRLAGTLLVIADEGGLQFADTTDPSAPLLLGRVEIAGGALGAGADAGLAVVAAGTSGVFVVDVADPRAPRVVGQTHTRANLRSFAADAILRGRQAYIADGAYRALGGVRVVDVQEPTAPVIAASSTNLFGAVAVAVERQFLGIADFYFTNGIPLFTLQNNAITYSGLVDFSQQAASFDGAHIDMQNGLAVVVGNDVLEIGRYAVLTEDGEGRAPTIVLSSPVSGAQARERTRIRVAAEPSDDIGIERVEFFANGTHVGTVYAPPYELDYRLGEGPVVQVKAAAVDFGGNRAETQAVEVNVIPDDSPTVDIIAPAAGTKYVSGSTMEVNVVATDDMAVASVSLWVDDQLAKTLSSPPYRFTVSMPSTGQPVALRVVARDNVAQETAAERTLAAQNDQGPIVTVLSPRSGQQVVANFPIDILVGAADDLGVSRVEVLLNGVLKSTLTAVPYEVQLQSPPQAGSLTIEARAFDTAEQTASATVVLTVVEVDPLTTVRGRTVDPANAPVAGATVTCVGVQGASSFDGSFELSGVPTKQGKVKCEAVADDGTRGSSREVDAVPAGITDVGTIVIGAAAGYLYPAPQIGKDGGDTAQVLAADLDGDGFTDLVQVRTRAIWRGTAAGIFIAAGSLPGSGGTEQAFFADLDRDGKLDIIGHAAAGRQVRTWKGNGDATFQPFIEYLMPTSGGKFAIGDWNHDGAIDFADVRGGSSLAIEIYLNDGNGRFGSTPWQSLPAKGTVAGIAAVDVNGDLFLDIVAITDFGRLLSTYLSQGGQGFAPRIDSAVSPTAHWALGEPADLDRDGAPEIVFTADPPDTLGLGRDRVLIYRGDRSGNWTKARELVTGVEPRALALGDLNHDGWIDIIAANEWNPYYSVFLNLGQLTFTTENVVYQGIGPVGRITLADVNQDGNLDLIDGQPTFILGSGTGSFRALVESLTNLTDVREFSLGDFDGDSRADLVAVDRTARQARVLRSRGDGTFDPWQSLEVSPDAESVLVSDVDGDGSLDFIILHQPSPSSIPAEVSVFFSASDGIFDRSFKIPLSSHTCAIATGDLNGDGRADIVAMRSGGSLPLGVQVYLSDGRGSFHSGPLTTADHHCNAAFGDFDEDGNADLVSSRVGDGRGLLLLGNGDGSFRAPIGLPNSADRVVQRTRTSSAEYDWSAVGDLNEDGHLDALLDERVFLGRGDGSFTYGQFLSLDNFQRRGVLGDLDGDGHLDVAFGGMTLYRGRGDGTFKAAEVFGSGGGYIDGGDIDGDGDIDIVGRDQVLDGGNIYLWAFLVSLNSR